MLQDEALSLLLETCGGTRMGHILLTLPYIRSAADRKLIQVNFPNTANHGTRLARVSISQ